MSKFESWARRWMAACLLVLVSGTGWAQDQDFPLPERVARLGSEFRMPLIGAEGAQDVWTIDDYLTQPRCLSHPLLVAEQGFVHSGTGFVYSGTDFVHSGTDFFHSGTVGGIVFGANDYVTPRSIVDVLQDKVPVSLQTSASSDLMLGELLSLEPKDGDVAIVVLDDFGEGSVYSLPSEAFSFTRAKKDQFQGLVGAGTISHGALVMHFLNAVIAASGQYTVDTVSPSSDSVVWAYNGMADARLIVRAVNLRDQASGSYIDTDDIASALGSAIETTVGQTPEGRQLNGIVVNMSWVLLPCPTVAAFVESTGQGEFQTFEDYIEGLKAMSPEDSWILDEGLSPEDIVYVLSWVSTNNPLYVTISQFFNEDSFLDPETRVGFVAASGNFRLPYQMLPAAWPAVVGVGAPVDNNPPPPFSNVGEVIATGAWFKVEPVLPWDLGSGGEMALAGTSYSAPIVSIFTAVDIASESRCTPPLFSGILPRLASYPMITPTWIADAAYGGNSKCKP